MVVIRLARVGRKRSPFYQIMVADRRNPRDGRFIERIGCYNPIAEGHDTVLHLEKERMIYWLNRGAQATLRVQHLIKNLKNSDGKAKEDGVGKGKLKRLQSEQQSAEAQKIQAKTAKEDNVEKVKVEEVPCG